MATTSKATGTAAKPKPAKTTKATKPAAKATTKAVPAKPAKTAPAKATPKKVTTRARTTAAPVATSTKATKKSPASVPTCQFCGVLLTWGDKGYEPINGANCAKGKTHTRHGA